MGWGRRAGALREMVMQECEETQKWGGRGHGGEWGWRRGWGPWQTPTLLLRRWRPLPASAAAAASATLPSQYLAHRALQFRAHPAPGTLHLQCLVGLLYLADPAAAHRTLHTAPPPLQYLAHRALPPQHGGSRGGHSLGRTGSNGATVVAPLTNGGGTEAAPIEEQVGGVGRGGWCSWWLGGWWVAGGGSAVLGAHGQVG